MQAISSCPSCGSADFRILRRHIFQQSEFLGEDVLPETASFDQEKSWIFYKYIWTGEIPAWADMVLCNNCGLIFTNPRLSDTDISTIYQTVGNTKSAQKRAKSTAPSRTGHRARRIFKLVSRYALAGKKKVLDFGGAEGFNLFPFKEEPDSCFLVDFSPPDPALGISYLGRMSADLQEGAEFDVIIAAHVFEHLINPLEELQVLGNHLSGEGVIYIEVPLGAWIEWKRMEGPIDHVNFFSEESICKLVMNSGLNVLYLSTDFQWIRSHSEWCINVIASKRSVKSEPDYQTSRSQMKYLKYALGMMLRNPLLLLKSLKARLKRAGFK